MKIGIDLDNTINNNEDTIKFFSFLTNSLRYTQSQIYIITNREKEYRDKTVSELKELGIYYDHLIITSKKEEVIMTNNINIYFDDTDEYFLSIPECVTVFKIREPGNFDFNQQKWVYDNKTGINIDDRK